MNGISAQRSATSALVLFVCLSCTACNFQELTATLFQNELRPSSQTEVADATPVSTQVTPPVAADVSPVTPEMPPSQNRPTVLDGHHDSEADEYMSGERHGGPGEKGGDEWYGGGYEGQDGYHNSDQDVYMQSSERGGPDGGPGGEDEDRIGYHDATQDAYMSSQSRGGPDGPANDDEMGSDDGSYEGREGYHNSQADTYMSSPQRGGPNPAMGGGEVYQAPPTMAQRGQPASQPTAPQGHALVRLQRGIALAQTTTAGTLMSFNIEYEASGVSSDSNTRYLLLIQPPRGRAQTMIVQLKSEGFLFAAKREWKDLRGEFKAQILEERRGQGVRAISQVLKLPAG